MQKVEQRRDEYQIYEEMSRVELEIDYLLAHQNELANKVDVHS